MNLSSLQKKIALGTVQLGLSYGINNSAGRPDKQTAFAILDLAANHNILLLDSAEAYGNSIQVIGAYLRNKNDYQNKIVSKFIDDGHPVEDKLNASLKDLGINQLYGYMYHRFADYESGKFKSHLRRLKDDQKIQHVGVSLYGLAELAIAIKDPEIDIIQIPFNPFDAAIEKKNLLREAKNCGKEIHVRSVFLQGLFFKELQHLTGNLVYLKDGLEQFHRLVGQHQLTIRAACLNHALHQPFIDHVIVGVETVDQLEQNLSSILPLFPQSLMEELESVYVENSALLNPSNWKP